MLALEGGHLGRAFPMPARWYAREPALSEDGEVLLFGLFFNDGPDMDRPATVRQLLEEFISLAEASTATILVFARRWGSLHLCAHGLPPKHTELSSVERKEVALALRDDLEEEARSATDEHNLARIKKEFERLTNEVAEWRPAIPPCPLPLIQSLRDIDGHLLTPSNPEAVEAWRSIAREFRAILDSAALLQNRRVPPRELWPGYRPPRHGVLRRLRDTDPYPAIFGSDTERIIWWMRVTLGDLVDRWLAWCPLQLRCSWTDYAPGVYLAPLRDSRTSLNIAIAGDFHHPLLLPVLSLQLSAALFDVRPVKRFCAVCGKPIEGRPRPGRPRTICERVACNKESVRRRKLKSLAQARSTSKNSAEKTPSRQSSVAKKKPGRGKRR